MRPDIDLLVILCNTVFDKYVPVQVARVAQGLAAVLVGEDVDAVEVSDKRNEKGRYGEALLTAR